MKKGLHIALLGPDGCGKSTLLPLLQERLAERFTGIDLYHWRPKVLSDAGVAARTREATDGPTTDPHGRPPHGALLSLARLLYYLFDYWLGATVIRRSKAEGKLILFDRYAPDMACDPRRYRFALPQWLLKLANRMAPSPDIGFILLADADVLYKRKQEVPFATLQSLLVDYRSVAGDNKAYQVIDCARKPEEVADDIAGRIIVFLGRRQASPPVR